MGFRFVNNFSNKLKGADPALNVSNGGLAGSFGAFQTFAGGHDPNKGRIAGSKHVEWYTNQDINSGNGAAKSEGFMNGTASGFTRSNDAQVGGFMITNASGVTYHYALPAYSENEIIYTEKIDAPALTYTQLTKPGKYAYTWYLTGITGPDFVDRGTLGVLDEQDWGYWVAFDYGQWTTNYGWRNPYQGFKRDMDGEFQSYSSGTKELYYLNTVRTRTHTAIFEKEARRDGSGTVQQVNIGVIPWASMLRLNKVYLLNNSDVPINLPAYSSGYVDNNILVQGRNVIDHFDIDLIRTQLEAKSIRIIDLKYSYDLCPGVDNYVDKIYSPSIGNNIPAGKLTLNEVKFLGKKGVGLIPATKFEYELGEEARRSGQVMLTSGNVFPPNSNETYGVLRTNDLNAFSVGDIIRFSLTVNQVAKVFYCVVMEKLTMNNREFNLGVNYLGEKPTSAYANLTATAVTTKNPPYNREFYDMWGMYKATYQKKTNENLDRYPDEISSLSKDVWSLRTIISPLDSKVRVSYESDSYANIALAEQSMLRINQFSRVDGVPNRFRLTFHETGVNLNKYFKLNTAIGCAIVGYYRFQDEVVYCDGANRSECSWNDYAFPGDLKNFVFDSQAAVVKEMGAN